MVVAVRLLAQGRQPRREVGVEVGKFDSGRADRAGVQRVAGGVGDLGVAAGHHVGSVLGGRRDEVGAGAPMRCARK